MQTEDVITEFLSRAAGEGLPDQIGPEDTLDRVAVCAELVDAGFLTGNITLGGDGRPVNVSGARITISGREHLQQLTKTRHDARPLIVVGRRTKWVLRWVVLPVAMAVVSAWLIKHFGFK